MQLTNYDYTPYQGASVLHNFEVCENYDISTCGLTNRCSSSELTDLFVRVVGFEPTLFQSIPSVINSHQLKPNQLHQNFVVVEGFEPPTPSVSAKCSHQTELRRKIDMIICGIDRMPVGRQESLTPSYWFELLSRQKTRRCSPLPHNRGVHYSGASP